MEHSLRRLTYHSSHVFENTKEVRPEPQGSRQAAPRPALTASYACRITLPAHSLCPSAMVPRFGGHMVPGWGTSDPAR